MTFIEDNISKFEKQSQFLKQVVKLKSKYPYLKVIRGTSCTDVENFDFFYTDSYKFVDFDLNNFKNQDSLNVTIESFSHRVSVSLYREIDNCKIYIPRCGANFHTFTNFHILMMHSISSEDFSISTHLPIFTQLKINIPPEAKQKVVQLLKPYVEAQKNSYRIENFKQSLPKEFVKWLEMEVFE